MKKKNIIIHRHYREYNNQGYVYKIYYNNILIHFCRSWYISSCISSCNYFLSKLFNCSYCTFYNKPQFKKNGNWV